MFDFFGVGKFDFGIWHIIFLLIGISAALVAAVFITGNERGRVVFEFIISVIFGGCQW